MAKINYIPEEELEDGKWYYVHNTYCPEGPRNAPIRIKQRILHDWNCDGLGSGGSWNAIAKVPELNIDSFIEKEEQSES